MRKAHNRIELDESYVISEYLKGRTATDISKELGVSKQVVLTRLKENGIEIRQYNPVRYISYEDLYKYYVVEREGVIAIAKRFGCGKTFVNNKLHEYGIPVRKKSSDPAFTKEERRQMYGMPQDKHPHWKGGLSKINNYLRNYTHDWRTSIFAGSDRTCHISGLRSESLEVHHSKPFSQIRDEAFEESGIDRREFAGDYTPEELDAIGEIIRTKHEGVKGYVIDAQWHSLFHVLYGHDTTDEQLEEFKTRYRLGEFGEITAIA